MFNARHFCVSLAAPGRWTDEQWDAIKRRSGDLLLDAAAGSGKTSVLVERFVQAVLEDGVEVGAILTITFTDKAAAEMRDRIRARLRELGAVAHARATEGAPISTIHGFCARLLRTHALAAGIDPAFEVLDEQRAVRLAEAAFADALEELAAGGREAVDLIASYGPGLLRDSIRSVFAELRSRGEVDPRLPVPAPAPPLEPLRAELAAAARVAAADLGSVADPSVRVVQALERVERCVDLVGSADPWPGDLDTVRLPNGNGAALSSAACSGYAEALGRFREACERRRAGRAHALLGRLLSRYGALYAERKREVSALDFEDLELMARELLRSDAELRERYRDRFAQVMVDELQDTNAVQLELIEMVADGNLFTVGDAQQSIYAFRHADVELFERRGEKLEQIGARARLQTNFRSRPEIVAVLNHVFADALGESFRPLRAGRVEARAEDPRVELLIADKGADWTRDGLGSPWRVAEARALARRVCELIAGGASPKEIVVLTRATTDLRVYERALEERGVPTYVIGGRGYWSHPQVVDLVGYLRALCNPRDEEALYTVLASPLVGVSVDALVVLADAGRSSGRDPWWVLRDPGALLDELREDDRRRLTRFASWFEGERAVAPRAAIDELIERALELTGYDLEVLAMPGGRRRLANVRKLMRLGREHEDAAGPDLRGFLELVRTRADALAGAEARESEAPVEGEALDAVRLMTIHRAKGLEFEIVCVADLGRGPRWRSELIRVGRDGRFGLRLAEPGTGRREPALDYRALGEERAAAEAREERRLFYVAMTRARERLILSGAAKLDPWPEGGGAGPIAWLGPALIEEIGSRVADGRGVTPEGVRFEFVREDPQKAQLDAGSWTLPEHAERSPGIRERSVRRPQAGCDLPSLAPSSPPAPPVSSLSYSSLGEYRRCGYRFYVERVLGLPPVEEGASDAAPPGTPGPSASSVPRSATALTAAERGVLVHALLERMDFRRPVRPTAAIVAAARERASIARAPTDAEIADIADLVEAFGAGELCARLARATSVAREQRFAFLLDGIVINGVFDVLARERAGGSLVVDYKTDRLDGADPRGMVVGTYATQRVVYALAALRAGAREVEVAHVFLEAPACPVTATFSAADRGRLEAELRALTGPVLRGEFTVTDEPHRGVCGGCPAQGGLCSWPLEMTRREAPDQLF